MSTEMRLEVLAEGVVEDVAALRWVVEMAFVVNLLKYWRKMPQQLPPPLHNVSEA